VVSRLVGQKGLHLIKRAMWRTLERGGQFVLLGSAPDGKIQNEFNDLVAHAERAYPDQVRMVFQYDEPLSHLIYAGSDMILVPSMFEPCGLTQMIAMRYGSLPVVRRTGGLRDTVFDVDDDRERAAEAGCEVNGFSFDGKDEPDMDYSLDRAINYWFNDRERWDELTQNAMAADWSWKSPAQDYIDMYYNALSQT
jgi:starch synthase